MTKAVIALALLTLGVAVSARDDDPVRDRLSAAKKAYDTESELVHKQVAAWFDKREDAARLVGDREAVKQIAAERADFEGDGEVPYGAPPGVHAHREKALRALEASYAEALKDYAKARMGDKAAAVEAELKNISARLNAVDLLGRVNPKTHALEGEWAKKGRALHGTSSAQGHARLQLPYEPGEEYDLEVKCQRLSGLSALGVGLVAGKRQVIAAIDSWPSRGHASGLQLVDGKEPTDNVTTVKGQILMADQSYTLVYSVRAGQLDVTVDGKTLFAYRGEASRLSCYDNYRPPNKRALFLFIAWKQASFRIDSITVLPVKGKGTVLK